MIRSMTAYASRTGSLDAASWTWEMRGVNGRGLDFKTRLPDGMEPLESAIRGEVKKALGRGVVTATLRLSRDETVQGLKLNEAQLTRVLTALDEVQDRAFSMGVTLNQPSTADVLAQRGVIVSEGGSETLDASLIETLKTDFEALLSDFCAMRSDEGAALHGILAGQLTQIEDLIEQAHAVLADRAAATRLNLQNALKRITDEAEVDPDRMLQELALVALKQDVTEEVDRLRAHVKAARQMLDVDGPVGRKLDFLSQEFNREANTLCAKSQFAPLTRVGLELKSVIDQMREQIQNVE